MADQEVQLTSSSKALEDLYYCIICIVFYRVL